jgi:bifunctional non-homologous end joining protein LigD
VLALDDEGRLDFHLLMRRRGQLHYAAFDLLWLNGQDLRAMPLVIRRRRLEKLILEPTSALSRVLAVAEDGRALFEAAQRLDLEGIVAKRKADPYEAGVTWYKIKNPAYTQMEGRGDLFHEPR